MNGGRIIWLNAEDPPAAFPPINNAMREPDGLLAAGGDLSTKRLVYAYREGIFPWYDEGQPILWWSPDPRCIIEPGDFHVSRRLLRELKTSKLELSFNQSFADVMRACAEPRPPQLGTWITPDMLAAYERLNREGWAHSIEVRDGGELIGGVYGIAIGRVFFGESMFSARTNASKIAMLGLSAIARSGAFELIDCQVVSSHLMTIGAETIPRPDFLDKLRTLCEPATPFEAWPEGCISVQDLASKWRQGSLQ